MRIQSLDSRPVHEIRCLNAGRNPGHFAEERIPVLTGVVSGLPDGIDALVVTSDLQARETFHDACGLPPRLLGEAVAERLAGEWLPDWGLPHAARTGIVLAGDFWTEPALDARGGIGDVTPVWRAFGRHFAWVAGVAGNHDAFGREPGAPPRFNGNLHFVDGRRECLDGLSVAGVSGIIGNPRKPWRRTDEDYLEAVERVLRDSTQPDPIDILILHDGPDVLLHGFKGWASVRVLIENHPPRLVIRGHDHWPEPLVELECGVQVLNVDKRVVVLRRESARWSARQ